mmetsp:Transcript_693/g.799  ORF Transcript_693/g.799 Transcript_693/m.799 type:complete len:1529 (-) Transcript_693:95-4681(-)
MTTPMNVPLFREWSPIKDVAQDDHHLESKQVQVPVQAVPVKATLVPHTIKCQLPKIHRKGSLLFQQAYDYGVSCTTPISGRTEGLKMSASIDHSQSPRHRNKLGQSLVKTQSNLNVGPDMNVDHDIHQSFSLPSSWRFEHDDEYDVDEGEVHFVDGQILQVCPNIDDNDDEYEEVYMSRRAQPTNNRFRKLLNKGKAKDKEKIKVRDKPKGTRERKFSRDKKIKNAKNKSKLREHKEDAFAMDPAIDGNRKPKRWSRRKTSKIATFPIPFAIPCNQQDDMEGTNDHNANASFTAPVQQYMYRTAAYIPAAVEVVRNLSSSFHGVSKTNYSPSNGPHGQQPLSQSQPTNYGTPHTKPHVYQRTRTDKSWLHHNLSLESFDETDGDVEAAKTPNRVTTNLYGNEDANSTRQPRSFCNFMKATNIVLDSAVLDGDISELETELSPPRIHLTTLPARTQSFPKKQPLKYSLSSSFDEDAKDALERSIHRVDSPRSKLQSCLLTPPRRRGRIPNHEVPEVNSPPPSLFKSFSERSPDNHNTKLRSVSKEVTSSHKVIKPPVKKSKENCNNTLKVVFVGSRKNGKTSLINSLTKNNKKQRATKKSVDVNIQTWNPAPEKVDGGRNVKFNMWDLQGGSLEDGAHHATQSLFFSSNSLYVLVWDMGVNNVQISPLDSSIRDRTSSYDSDDFDEDLYKKDENAIKRDIEENVIYWLDVISKHSLPGCCVLPVVTFKDELDEDEVDHRCKLLKDSLNYHTIDSKAHTLKVIFDANNDIPRVSTTVHGETRQFEQCLLDITTDTISVFKDHLNTQLCAVTLSVQQVISSFKNEGYKVLRLEHIMVKLLENPPASNILNLSLVRDALNFLAIIGNITYFGTTDSTDTNCKQPHLLGDFVILSPKWVSNAISLILRQDLKTSLTEIKRQSRASSEHLPGLSSPSVMSLYPECPVLTTDETILLWNNTEIVRKVSEQVSYEGSYDLYYFLQQVCEHCGIFVPFQASMPNVASTPMSNRSNQTFYFLPSLTNQVPSEFWSYRVKDDWKTSLCNAFIFQNRTPCNFADKVAAASLKELFEISCRQGIRVEIICWKTAIYAKVIEQYRDMNTMCATEIFTHLAPKESMHYVNSIEVSEGRQLIVSAKGYGGRNGEKIWNLGYGSILEAIENEVGEHAQKEIVCPECLKEKHIMESKMWKADHISTLNTEALRCSWGHSTDPHLVLGPDDNIDDSMSVSTGIYSAYSSATNTSTVVTGTTCTTACSQRNVESMVPAVVIVGLWNKAEGCVENVGSGFIADRKRGLIVTASHIFFDYEKERAKISEQFYGLRDATVIIGIYSRGSDSAIFTYTADIVASDVYNVDACVLRIRTKFETPVALDESKLRNRTEYPVSSQIIDERLPRLKLLPRGVKIQRDTKVRAIGFRQDGEGIWHQGKRINRIPASSHGYVSKQLGDKSRVDTDTKEFVPRYEIVVVECSTSVGSSGGPFVDEQGNVIGILSRSDPVDNQRCYLAPAREIMKLLKEAKAKCDTQRPHFSHHAELAEF